MQQRSYYYKHMARAFTLCGRSRKNIRLCSTFSPPCIFNIIVIVKFHAWTWYKFTQQPCLEMKQTFIFWLSWSQFSITSHFCCYTPRWNNLLIDSKKICWSNFTIKYVLFPHWYSFKKYVQVFLLNYRIKFAPNTPLEVLLLHYARFTLVHLWKKSMHIPMTHCALHIFTVVNVGFFDEI